MNKFLRERWYVLPGLIILAVGIFFFSTRSKPKPGTTVTVKRQTLTETLSFSGSVAADQDVTLRFPTSGRLVWVGVKAGDTVKKYQTIASLDQREVRANLQKYLNTYSSDRRDFDQTLIDAKNKVLTDTLQRTLEKSQFDLNSSVLDVEIKNLAVEYSNLWSPIDGLVVTANVPQAGLNVTPTQAEFEIINPASIYFSATADQTEVVQLSASQSAEITLDSYPDKIIHSEITSLAFVPKTGETGTVYEVKMNLPVDNSQYKYRIGMTGDVSFIAREIPNALVIPTKAIKSQGNTKYVWLNDKNLKVKQIITVGDAFDNLTEVKSGLNEGDIIYEN